MGDHDLIGDNAPDNAPPDIVEAKVWASTGAAAVAAVGTVVLEAIQGDPAMIAWLPLWLQYPLMALIPPLLVLAAGYWKRSNRV